MQYSSIAVFDIGGTWFRSSVYNRGEGLTNTSKIPAINYKNTPHNDPRELQLKLVDYFVERLTFFRKNNIKITAASISMGAALNEHTGEILNSGPLWGPNCERFDLPGHLKRKMPEVEWVIINDVSAALLRFTDEQQYAEAKRINLITVSSGVACRTFDRSGNHIPINKDGIQGEIGHIPISFTLLNETINKQCDCGGNNHLNAFSSGRGIANVLRHYASRPRNSPLLKQLQGVDDDHILNAAFFTAVRADDSHANEILDAVTYPIANMIIHMLTIDAEIEKIIMTGGVVHAIEAQYMKSLLSNLRRTGLYQVSHQTAFFKNVITVGTNDDNSGLIGAAIAYENKGSRTI